MLTHFIIGDEIYPVKINEYLETYKYFSLYVPNLVNNREFLYAILIHHYAKDVSPIRASLATRFPAFYNLHQHITHIVPKDQINNLLIESQKLVKELYGL